MFIEGTSGNDIIKGYNEDNIYNVKAGADTIKDYWGNDTYLFNKGDGNDTITDSNGNDIIKFGEGIVKSDLEFSIIYDNTLTIKLKNSNDSLTIINWTDNKYKIEEIQFADGSLLKTQDIENILYKTNDLVGTADADIINGTTEGDKIFGLAGNDTIAGLQGDDVIDGGSGADLMKGGAGNDNYFVDNISDVIDETLESKSNSSTVSTAAPPDASWISSGYLKDIYTRTYPRVMGNQWSVTPDGLFFASAQYNKDTAGNPQLDMNATLQENNKMLDLVTTYMDYITLNRVGMRTGTNDYNDIFLDNYDSVMNAEKGLLKTKNDIYNLAESKDTRVYVLPYLSMADVNVYQSVNNFPDWNFWQSQKYSNGENFGTFDFIDKNDLYLRSASGEILHYYGGTNSSRPLFDSRNPIVQDYLIKHVSDIVNAGYDGVFSDNWWRTKYTGDMSKLTQAEFEKIQEGWNTIGKGIQNNIGDNILVGNSPQYDAFGSRDVVMLEDRIDDVVGSGDKSIASYFKYSENARASNQVTQDTYWDEVQGPFETFRIPINLLTDNILGIGSVTKGGTDVTEFILPLRTLGEIGYPIGNKVAVQGTQTGTFDNIDNFSLERAVYKRDYSNGLVFLNDTLTQQTVTLPQGQWLRSDGIVFSEGATIALDSTRGWVFKKLGEEQSIVIDAGGIDLVNSSISYNLGKYIENLNLTGTQDINAVGNELNNVINGNTANNIIEGKTGNDILQGGTGNETYIFNIGDGQDTINDISGVDKLKFSGNITKEDLTFTKEDKNIVISLKNTTDKITVQNWADGNKIETIEFSNNINLTSQDVEKTVGIGNEPPPSTITPTITGTDANDSLSGNNGDDIYLAKKGYDRIKDYSGNDIYLFDKGDNWDTITDTSGSDSIIFGQNINKNDVKITKDGNNVQFAINGTNDGITVVDWYQNSKFVIEKVQFNDGSFLSNNDINSIIQGISSFTANSEAQISLTPSTTTNQNTLPELVSS